MSKGGGAGFDLRPATARDSAPIKRLIRHVRINPTGLNWRRFAVAVEPSGRLIGCGQLKPHAGGVIELASIAVVPSVRRSGVARAIIEYLLERGPRPLYLTCRGSLGPFYQKSGFRVLKADEMPAYFLRLSRIAAFISGVLRDEGMLVMMLQ